LVTQGKKFGHIMVTTQKKLKDAINARKPLDLSELRVVVIDEADFFFCRKEDAQALQEIDQKYIKKLPQKV